MRNFTKLIVLAIILGVLIVALLVVQNSKQKEIQKISLAQSALFFPDLNIDKVMRIEVTCLNSRQKESLLFRKQAGIWEVAAGKDVFSQIMENTEKNKEENSDDSNRTAGSTEPIKPADDKPIELPSETKPKEEEKPKDPRQDVGPAGDPYRAFYKADPDKVKNMLNAIANLKHGNLVTSNPEKKSIFGVLSSLVGTEIVLYDEQMNKLASLILGNAGSAFQSCYVRLPDSNDIYEVSENLKMIFEQSLLAVRDKSIFRVAPESITSFSLKDYEMKNEINLTKSEGVWHGTDGKGNVLELGVDKVDTLLSNVGNLSANSFVDPNDILTHPENRKKDKEDPYGFSSPTLEIKFTTTDNVTHTLTVGKLEGTISYAYADGRIQDVFRLSNTSISDIRPSPQSLKGEPKANQLSNNETEVDQIKEIPVDIQPVNE